MKKLIIIAGLAGVFTGCATAPYQTVATTQVAAETAVQEYDAWVKSQPTQNLAQNEAVKQAYDRYQAAMLAVADAGQIWQAQYQTNSSVSTAVLQQAVSNANQDLTDLDNLIAAFGVKLQ